MKIVGAPWMGLVGCLLLAAAGCEDPGTGDPSPSSQVEVTPTETAGAAGTEAPTATAPGTATEAPTASAPGTATQAPTATDGVSGTPTPPPATPSAEPTPSPQPTVTPAPTEGSTATPPLSTDAPTAPPPTDGPTVEPTDTPPPPTAGLTDTPPPPTDAPTAGPTDTPPPPTATPTDTPPPPTDTPLPPTATPTAAPTPTPTAPPTPTAATDLDGDGYSAAEDCDDGDPAVNPGADEVCNGIDDDCDQQADDADDDVVDPSVFYADDDDDGFGDLSSPVSACQLPEGASESSDDCDDGDPAVHPGADEVCNGVDDDCDGAVDQPDPIDGNTWYADVDGDGYGDPGAPIVVCGPAPDGAVDNAYDCDDSSPAIYPGTDEGCTAGESCLNVLELGFATGTGLYWIDPPNKDAYQELCDFGTVADGWSGRLPITLNNPGEALSEHWAPVALDTQALIDAGWLSPGGPDLRVGTHDGPLLKYWYDGYPDDGPVTLWIRVPELPAGSLDLTLFFGNPATERRSIAWLFEDFSADRSDRFTSVYDVDRDWLTPSWSWNLEESALQTDNTNADYFLHPNALEITYPIYVETWAITSDDDAVGALLLGADGALYVGNVSDDYNGVDNGHSEEGIVAWAQVPKNHREASTLLSVGNLVPSRNNLNRIGLSYDGATMGYHLNGALEGTVDVGGLEVATAGVASMANSETASLFAFYYYMWIGSEPIDFNPLELSSPATAQVGAAGPFYPPQD